MGMNVVHSGDSFQIYKDSLKTYDKLPMGTILRAIAFELNNGFSLEETLMDLNISKETSPAYNIKVEFEDGAIWTTFNERISNYSNDKRYIWFYFKQGNRTDSMRLDFTPSDIIVDFNKSKLTIDPDLVRRYIDDMEFDMDNSAEKARYDYLKQVSIKKITFERVLNDYVNKYVM